MERFLFKEALGGEGTLAFESYGFDFPQALENACLAVSSLQTADSQDFCATEHVVVDERGATLEELAAAVLSELLLQVNEKELLVKQVSLKDFRRGEDSSYSARIVAIGGPLEQATAPRLVESVELAVGAVKQEESGHWSIQASVIFADKPTR